MACSRLPLLLRASFCTRSRPRSSPRAAQAQKTDTAGHLHRTRAPTASSAWSPPPRRKARVTFYTSMQTPESGPLVAGVREEIRHQGPALARDQRPGRSSASSTRRAATASAHDVVETNAPEVERSRARASSPSIHQRTCADLPDWARARRTAAGTATRANLWVVAFNTSKVKKEEIPPTYEGFVDPKWKGRIGIESTDQDWMYAVVQLSRRAARHGDVPQALGAAARHAARSRAAGAADRGRRNARSGSRSIHGNADSIKKRGGPIDWVAVEPIVGRPQAVGGRAQRAASERGAAVRRIHAVAGGPEGAQRARPQPVEQARRRRCSRKFKYQMVDPIEWVDEASKWEKLWQELFLKR